MLPMLSRTLRLPALLLALSFAPTGDARPTVLPLHSPVALATTSATAASQTTAQVIYDRSDEQEVERLLNDTSLRTSLDFARRLKGRPYVAATLEVADPERLVVNLRGLDCATLVETASALAMTRREGKRRFADYCRNLERLRYFDGHVAGYTSRLHYLSFWMADHLRRKTIEEVVLPTNLTQPLHIDLHYMSRHAESYPMLRNHPERVREIARLERKYSGNVGRFIPKKNVDLSRNELGAIHDGDVIAVVTRKDGLDYSHQGLAYWGKDGKLHMLHASSQYKKVIEDSRTLSAYLAGISHAIGIRVFRVR